MDATTVSLEQVRSLVAERQRYEEWLQALEGRRAETPARVYERVHADYTARRDGVTQQLRDHVDTLTTLRDALASRLSSLDATVTQLEEERAEAELRTAVGEYDSGKWEEVRSQLEQRLADERSAREKVVAEVDEVQHLLASARAEPAVQPSAVEPEPAPAVAPAAEAQVEALLDETIEDVVESAPKQAEAREEWISASNEAVDDVLPMMDDAPVVVPVAEVPAAPANAAPAADDGFDDLAFLRSVVDGGNSESQATVRASAATDQQKTLRCTDCGTMNLPTEWYCERCGGELAAF